VHTPTYPSAAAAQTSKLANNKLLLAASGGGDLEAVRRLVEGGADLDARDEHGCTPLHLAARARRIGVTRFLAAQPLPWVFDDAAATDDSTPLHEAIVRGDGEVVAILAAALSNVRAAQRWRWRPRTAMTLAVEAGHLAVVCALADTPCGYMGPDGATETPLGIAARSDKTHSILRFLALAKRTDLHTAIQRLLMSAIHGGAVLNVKFLLEMGACTAGYAGHKLLQTAFRDLPEVVGTLLAFGAVAEELLGMEYDAEKRPMLVDMCAAAPKAYWCDVSDAGLHASAEERRIQWVEQNLRRVLAGVFAEVYAILHAAMSRTRARFTRGRGGVEVADQAFLAVMCKLPEEVRFMVTKYVARNVVIAWAGTTDTRDDPWWADAGRGRAILPVLWRIPGGQDMLYGVDFNAPTQAMLAAYAAPARLRPGQ
jgi:ankyrin repeat protein